MVCVDYLKHGRAWHPYRLPSYSQHNTLSPVVFLTLKTIDFSVIYVAPQGKGIL